MKMIEEEFKIPIILSTSPAEHNDATTVMVKVMGPMDAAIFYHQLIKGTQTKPLAP